MNSIVLAKKIIKGEITFSNHLNNENNVMKKKVIKVSIFNLFIFKSIEKKIEESETEESQENNIKPSKENKDKSKDTSKDNREKRLLKNKTNRNDSGSLEKDYLSLKPAKSTTDNEKEINNKRKNNTHNIKNKRDDEPEEIKQSLTDKLKEKIKELVFFRIELPSATSNKSIISTLEEMHSIIAQIIPDNINEVKYNFNNNLFYPL